jgi:polyvinyl alcohol dehydrogenase (cytochrome)
LGPSGVAVWNSPSIDAARGQLYVATGDNYTEPGTSLSDAILALDLATGRIKWHYQALANDTWNVACVTKTSSSCPPNDSPDFDFGAGTVWPRARMASNMSWPAEVGLGLCSRSRDGQLAWKTRVGRGSPGGGVHFGMAADGGMLFVPVVDNYFYGPNDFAPRPDFMR